MRGYDIKTQLFDNLRYACPITVRKGVLNFAHISRCPARLYSDLLSEPYQNNKWHWFNLIDRVYREAITELLDIQKIAPLEVIAEFDSRFRGEILTLYEGNPALVLPVSLNEFHRVIDRKECDHCHFEQAQLLLRHGGYDVCHLLYVARDVSGGYWQGIPVWTFDIMPKKEVQDRLDQKARWILGQVDEGGRPRCECGRC